MFCGNKKKSPSLLCCLELDNWLWSILITINSPVLGNTEGEGNFSCFHTTALMCINDKVENEWFSPLSKRNIVLFSPTNRTPLYYLIYLCTFCEIQNVRILLPKHLFCHRLRFAAVQLWTSCVLFSILSQLRCRLSLSLLKPASPLRHYLYPRDAPRPSSGMFICTHQNRR